jgi:hypothetical protein
VVAIVVDGEIVAEAPADLERPDLAEYGANALGFLIALPESLKMPGRRRVLALAGPQRRPLAAAPSFWHDPGSAGDWSDVVFEPGELLADGPPSTQVPAPPGQPPDRRAVAAAGWLFDARESQPLHRLGAAELDQLAESLANATSACAAFDVRYIPAVVPSKRLAVGLAATSERESVAALLGRLRQNDDVDLIDLLPVLRDAASHGPCYHRTDSDWNDRGAFFVARGLLKEAHKHVTPVRPPALADLHLLSVPGYRGTLADVPKLEVTGDKLVPREPEIDFEDGVVIDTHRLRSLRMPVERHLAEGASVHMRVYANPVNDGEAHIAVVGEACCMPLLPWLAEPNRRATFFWSPALPLHELELELPLVVFHLIDEAKLLTSGTDLIARTPAR